MHRATGKTPDKTVTDCPMPFGKYHGIAVSEITKEDPDYIIWLNANVDLRGDVKSAVEHHLPLAQKAEAAKVFDK